MADEPVLACPPSAAYRFRKFVRRHKTGLSTLAVVLLVVLLASGGVGWVLWERAAQRSAQSATTERTVSAALTRAEQLDEQARKMPSATSVEAAEVLVVRQQADDALAQAKAALTTGTDDDVLRDRVDVMRSRLEQGRRQTEHEQARALRKENLFRDLDEARMASLVFLNSDFDPTAIADKFGAAFAAYGLEVKPAKSKELAERIRAEVPAVRAALLLALDEWICAASKARAKTLAAELRAIVPAADDDPWRQRLRRAAVAGDRAALRDLSAEARRLSLRPASVVLLSEYLVQTGQRAEAVAALRWARRSHPTEFWIHYSLGIFLLTPRAPERTPPLDLTESVGCFRTALVLRPQEAIVHNNLGTALKARNQLDEAIDAFRKAIALDSRVGKFHNNLAVTLYQQRKTAAAIAVFRKAIAVDPKHAYEARVNLSLILAENNQPDEAIAECRKALAIRPGDYAYNALGLALAGKKQWDEAIDAYRKALKLNPRLAIARLNLGNALKARNRVDEAIAEYRKAIDLDPTNADDHNNLGNALRDKNQLDDAMAAYRRAIDVDFTNVHAHYNLGRCLADKNRLDEAIAEYHKAIELDPRHPYAHLALGSALQRKGRFAEARTRLQRGMELLPQNDRLRNLVLGSLAECNHFLALEARLPRILGGKERPKDHHERLAFLTVCRLQSRHLAATQLYADGFTADAGFADDLKAGHRYNAACHAGLAAAGQGTDAEQLDEKERSRWRKQAIAWLRADLIAWDKRLADGTAKDRQTLRATLLHWQRDTDLAGVRDPQALKRLPAEERDACRKFWATVASRLAPARGQ
jgi:tetratricopeptide (TPR) repeat protein